MHHQLTKTPKFCTKQNFPLYGNSQSLVYCNIILTIFRMGQKYWLYLYTTLSKLSALIFHGGTILPQKKSLFADVWNIFCYVNYSTKYGTELLLANFFYNRAKFGNGRSFESYTVHWENFTSKNFRWLLRWQKLHTQNCFNGEQIVYTRVHTISY